MANAGLNSLIVVNGQNFDDDAYARSVYGKYILDDCKRVDSLDEIVKNFDVVAATSGDVSFNERKFRRIPVSPEDFWSNLIGTKRKIALVFGREDDGLRNAEVEKCNYFINIPSSPDFPSYNLSHAVGIILYEMIKHMSAPIGNHDLKASSDNLALLEKEVEKLMELSEYSTYYRKNSMIMLKRLIARSNITDTEYHKLMGIVSILQRKVGENIDFNKSRKLPESLRKN